ncbi:hypothetical protein EEL32_15380 [Brevibacillus laterosporus]|nr:hypothetical protein [Brevibacillus laterosporus]TPG69836.1 hypothetical protein EEL31_15960 [Brevibacillus laterosporus]TPG85020.1 hypothetical protein EEL32_15380 [Brevibacillus laterosporus]
MDYLEGNTLIIAIRQAMDYLINWLCGIIQQGIVKNELAHHIEPKTVALYILSTVEGALVISRLHEDREVLAIIKQQLIAYLFSLSS